MTELRPAVREGRTVGSALWAAFGDALGFPTELATPATVRRRIGSQNSRALKAWTRRVGGKYGVDVQIPEGGYSDDTQLRLATCRSIRGDGEFDVETFSKVELPVWLCYCLGAGRGSKAAAANLSNKKVAWFSNFFDVSGATYIGGGGNGAAMRVQPHVWAAEDLGKSRSFLADVARNSLVTHGHMRGVAGALVHAAALATVLSSGKLPVLEEWFDFADAVRSFGDVVQQDSDLSDFWLPTWERAAGQTIASAIDEVVDEWTASVSAAARVPHTDPIKFYNRVVESLGGLTSEERGSGLKCALFSLVAAGSLDELGPRGAIELPANLLGSDTDTIATLTGALVGATDAGAAELPRVQDCSYIRMEAVRLFHISQRKDVETFVYPDLLYWNPPKGPMDAVGDAGGQLTLAGLGRLTPVPEMEPISQRGTVWQWFELPFGQRILCRYRAQAHVLDDASLPEMAIIQGRADTRPRWETNVRPRAEDLFGGARLPRAVSVEELVDKAIRSGFDPALIGGDLLRLAEGESGMEFAIGYAATLAKARRARLKKGGG